MSRLGLLQLDSGLESLGSVRSEPPIARTLGSRRSAAAVYLKRAPEPNMAVATLRVELTGAEPGAAGRGLKMEYALSE
jgi:hypothetical protein